MKKNLHSILTGLFFVTASLTSNAQTFSGTTVSDGYTNNVAVGAGIEFNYGGSTYDINPSNSRITFYLPANGTFTAATYTWTFTGGDLASFTSITKNTGLSTLSNQANLTASVNGKVITFTKSGTVGGSGNPGGYIVWDFVSVATPTSTTWNGTTWSNSNPSSTINAIISDVSNTAPASFTCKNLTINSGAALSITGITATVNGNITNNGNGISGTGNLTIAASSALSGNAISFDGVLTVNTGATLTTNGLLTLSSNNTNTASLAAVAGTISGNVTVERYIPAHSSRAYTLVSSPVSSPTIKAGWQEGGASTPNYGTQITGANTGSIDGFDAVSAAGIASIYSYDDNAIGSKWVGLVNTNVNTLSAGTGYLLFVRGDRTVAPGGANSSTATTLRATGTLTTGTVTFATSGGTAGTAPLLGTAAKYSLIANPYPCAIDWLSGSITKSNINASFTIYDPSLGSFISSDGTTKSPNSGQQQARYIQSGQAFFIQANTSAPSLVIAEAAKTTSATTSASTTVFGTQLPTAQLNVNFYRADNSFADGAVAVFNNNYSKQDDAKDADKFLNFNETISFSENTRTLSIDARPMPVNDTLQINTNKMTANTTYNIAIDGNGFDNTNLSSAVLIDNLTSIRTNIDISGITNYSFTTTTANESGRLQIVLNNKSTAIATDDTNTELSVTLGANPVTDHILVNYAAKQSGNTSIRLINIAGQSLTNINLGLQQNGQISIPVSQYTKGLYLVEVIVGENKVLKKVMKD